jgi:hypothetical protein
MVKRLLAWSLIAALVTLCVPTPILATAKAQATGTISGIARDEAMKPVANRCVQLRNVDTKQVVATSKTNDKGEFTFTGVQAGRYQVEVLDKDCKNVLEAGSPVSLTKAVMIRPDVNVIVSEISPALGGGFFDSTEGALLVAAAGAGVTIAVGVTRHNASPSK